MKNSGQFSIDADALEKEALNMDNGLDKSVRKTKLSQAQKLRNQAGIINQSLKKAGDKVISKEELRKKDPTVVGLLEEMYPDKSGGELAMLFQRTFDNPGDQDFIDFNNKFQENMVETKK